MAGDEGLTLEAVAVELYGLLPDAFTAARNARAKSIADAALATAVKGLRKPLLAAWVVNVFARERAEELGEALELAEALREAQADLDAATMTALNRDRRALVRRLAEQAAELASARGERITPATTDAVQETLNAAMFDADAAAAVASGRLIRPLEVSGSGDADLSDAVAGGPVAFPRRATPPEDEVAARRERKQAELAAKTADEEVARARREAQDLERRRRTLGDRAQSLEARLSELETEMERVRADAVRVHEELDEIRTREAAASERVEKSERAAEAARARLDARPPR
ncbi:transposase [Microbacterium sp. SD291]|uniref:transposase n=1 Tax=Microbacterium sp. SD291 TaxID=2782007 RepID=UPI001A970E43|nr:transposase [Microbacterium sp. SD291]MBO0979028.1 transposase [Microbacterium sp. SD291]